MNLCSSSKALPSIVGDGQSSGIGFGCMGMTAFYGDPMSDDDALNLLKIVYDSGCRHFDTAEIYKTGNPFAHSEEDKYNETVVGSFLVTVPRDSYTVATKYMPQMHDSKCDYDSVKTFLTSSLKRLGIDYVDVYYSHRVPSLEAAVDFARSCKKLKEEGLIKNIGYSEICSDWLRKAHEECPVAVIQMEWSLITRNIEDDVVPTCKELGIVIVAYSPLARCLLSSEVTLDAPPGDWRGTLPRFTAENVVTNSVLIKDVLNVIAEKHDCRPSQMALAWIFKRAEQMGVTVVPIPGTTNPAHALTNVGATKIDLSDGDMEALDALSKKVVGLRGDDFYISWGFESQK